MNEKGRNLRAVLGLASLGLAMFLGADAWANRFTSDYLHAFALRNVLGFLAVALFLFAWNAIQYALHNRKK